MKYKGNKYKHINLGYLYDIAEGQKSFVVEMLGDYLISIPLMIKNLRSAESQSDHKQVYFHAHTLKSAFHFLGCEDFAGIASQIEVLGHEKKEMILVSPLIEKIEKIFPSIKAELDKELDFLKNEQH